MQTERDKTPRNIVLCCDGTSNHFSPDRTNVVKLYQTLIQDERQIVYYHPGLGTMEPPGALTPWRRMFWRTMGLAFGFGLSADIRDAYVFLMNTYEPGDRVYLFGFSRGAYTVRALAALLHMYGLLRRGNEAHVPYAIRMLGSLGGRHDDKGSTKAKQVQEFFALAAEYKKFFSTECPLHFVGVWDTVNSVGWVSNPLRLPYTANNPDIAVGRHALAIDERRAFFRQNMWLPAEPPAPSGPRDMKQVWFPGSHGDVGGGYPLSESGLSNEALKWMLKEAGANGLRVDQAKLNAIVGAPTKTVVHDQTKGWWIIAEFVPKWHWEKQKIDGEQKWVSSLRINFFRPRTIPEKPLVHQSSFTLPDYKPPNLPIPNVPVT